MFVRSLYPSYYLLLFSYSVVSDSLQPHELQHARLPCPSLSPGVCSNSCPLSWQCHPTISSSVIPFYLLVLRSVFPSIRVFSNDLALASENWLEWRPWERLKAGGEGNGRERDDGMASPTRWTWVWSRSGRWWRTVKPGVLQFMGSRRVIHDWVTEQQKTGSSTSASVRPIQG